MHANHIIQTIVIYLGKKLLKLNIAIGLFNFGITHQ